MEGRTPAAAADGGGNTSFSSRGVRHGLHQHQRRFHHPDASPPYEGSDGYPNGPDVYAEDEQFANIYWQLSYGDWVMHMCPLARSTTLASSRGRYPFFPRTITLRRHTSSTIPPSKGKAKDLAR